MRKKLVFSLVGIALSASLAGVAVAHQYPSSPASPNQPMQTPSQNAPANPAAPTAPAPAPSQQQPTAPTSPTTPAPTTPSQQQTPTTPAPTTPSPTTPSQTPTTAPTTPTAPGQLPTGQYPNVSNLKPFSAQANFMSLPGYLRYVVYQQTGQWLTRPEATRIVRQQGGM